MTELTTPLIQQVVDDLVSRHAYVVNLHWEVVAWSYSEERPKAYMNGWASVILSIGQFLTINQHSR